MNYIKIFLMVTILLVSQQTSCMFFPSKVWRNDPSTAQSNPESYILVPVVAITSVPPSFADLMTTQGYEESYKKSLEDVNTQQFQAKAHIQRPTQKTAKFICIKPTQKQSITRTRTNSL